MTRYTVLRANFELSRLSDEYLNADKIPFHRECILPVYVFA